jgi:hypothetical protein
MNLEQFLDELKRIEGWYVTTHGRIRRKSKEYLHCPITAVAENLTGQRFLITDYIEAARRIGLPESLAEEIANAADWATHKDLTDENCLELRRKLESVVFPEK